MSTVKLERMRDNRVKARDSLAQKLIKDAINSLIEDAETQEDIANIVEDHFCINNDDKSLVVEFLMKKKSVESTRDTMFITINPDPAKVDTLDKMRLLMEKLFKYKPIAELPIVYAYDQRGNSLDDIKGFHVHLVLQRKGLQKPYPIKQAFKACFKDVIDNVNDNHKLKFLEPKTMGDFNRCLNYVKGIKSSKKGKDKSANVQTTQEYLKSQNFEIFYLKNWVDTEDGKTEND